MRTQHNTGQYSPDLDSNPSPKSKPNPNPDPKSNPLVANKNLSIAWARLDSIIRIFNRLFEYNYVCVEKDKGL